MRKPRVLVAFNTTQAYPEDHDYYYELAMDDWQTEADVVDALIALKYPHELVGVYDDMSVLKRKIQKFKPDVIFNLIERFKNNTAHEADATSYLKLLGIPFTGCGPKGITFCKDKALSKKILSHDGLLVPKFKVFPYGKKFEKPEALTYPLFVKPMREEASVGISNESLVKTEKQLKVRIRFLHKTLNEDVIAEEYVVGRELYVALLGSSKLKIFPFREMVFTKMRDDQPKVASYKAKWSANYRDKWGIKNKFARLPKTLESKIKKLTRKACRSLEIRGAARFDIRLTKDEKVYFIEANPNPMLAEHEDFAVSAIKSGLSYNQLIGRMVKLALSNE